MDAQLLQQSLADYPAMSRLIKNHSYDDILGAVSQITSLTKEQIEQTPMGGYSKGGGSGAYKYTLQDLIKNIDSYDYVYGRLFDRASKDTFALLTAYRLFPATDYLKRAYDGQNPQYFDKSIVSCADDEVFVDCGAFTGDTVRSFIDNFKNYRRIYVYEPGLENTAEINKNLSGYKNINIRQCAVGERPSDMPYCSSVSGGTFMPGLNQHNADTVKITSLDADIPEKVSFIKMDIEGSEVDALLGAKNHIKNDFPKLAVSLYHIVSDIWEIPRLIDAIKPGYKFYLRHYNAEQNWETVLYAVPPEVNKITPKPRKRIVAPAPFECWENAHLTKDCGLLPFLLHKNHGHESVMLSAKNGEYPALNTYVNGLKMDFLPAGSVEDKAQYIAENATDIDALVLYGPYPTYYGVTKLYKALNPGGKVYLALDANSHWMDRMTWDAPEFTEFIENCNILGASCTAMQDFLNRKWPWKIHFIPNGFYDFSQNHRQPSFGDKENIILTVGRLGTPQKQTGVLLAAFAETAGKIPGWTLRLVGSVEPAFEPQIEKFYNEHPELKDRVVFTGSIDDKQKLYDEYKKAKIFALPSTFEGAPNVIAEALAHGCATAVTRFDAYADATCNGECGLDSPIGDTHAFADILYRLCTDPNLEQKSERAYEAYKSDFDMNRIAARVNEMIFGENNA